MKNSAIIFKDNIKNDIQYKDYTSYYYGGLYELLKEYKDFFMLYTCDIDDKIENISYKLYGSENYADIILLANNFVFLWNTSYNSDILLAQSSAYGNILRKEINLTTENIKLKLEKQIELINDELENLNSEKRIINVPKPEHLNTIISIIDDYRKENEL